LLKILKFSKEQSKPQQKEQSLKFSIKIANKTAASAAQLAKWFASRFSTCNCSSQLRENKQKLHIAYLTRWNNSIFGDKLRTD